MLRTNYRGILSHCFVNKENRLRKFRKLAQYLTADERRSWDSKPDVFRIHVWLSMKLTMGLGYCKVGSGKGWLLKDHLV